MKLFKRIMLFLMVVILTTLVACTSTNNKVTIEFVNTTLEDIEIDKGNCLEEVVAPTKEGFIFENWYTSDSFEEIFDFNTKLETNTKIYALYYLEFNKAIELGNKLEHNEVSKEEYFIKGKIKSIVQAEYGNMTITNGTDELFVYGVWSKDKTKRYDQLEDKPVINDTVLLRGPLKRFNESIELNNSKLYKMEKNPLPEIDLTEYDELSILAARNKEVNSKVVIEGVVAQITNMNNKTPNGVYIVDETNAMYIHSSNIALAVKVGDRIKVAGKRVNFILESEIENAIKYGYEGAIQLDEAYLIEHSKDQQDFNTDWIESYTIKELLETSPNEKNITGTIYKVNAFINKVPGNGFINYYFNDLDNKTGSYVYTMNNGSDFSWLDEYDGQLKTVYLSVINAKATNSGLVYRFVPIKIVEDFEYEQSYNPEFAVKYFGVDQFEKQYVEGFSPDLELITNVTFEKLNIENVKLNYSSSNINVIYFELIDDKVILKTNEAGKAKISIIGIDNDNSFKIEIEIEVVKYESDEFISVLEAIEKENKEKVRVKGVVGASLVNQVGFYLIDETGAIPVRMSKDELAKLKLGNLVIIEGTKDEFRKEYNENNELIFVGQLVIDDSVIIANLQGEHTYSTNSFKTDKQLKDFIDLDKTIQHSKDIYIFEATIKYTETPYYTRYELIDDEGNAMNIYSSNSSQLSFLYDYRNLKVIVEFSVVNWNAKKYVGSILSITYENEKIVNNSNFK